MLKYGVRIWTRRAGDTESHCISLNIMLLAGIKIATLTFTFYNRLSSYWHLFTSNLNIIFVFSIASSYWQKKIASRTLHSGLNGTGFAIAAQRQHRKCFEKKIRFQCVWNPYRWNEFTKMNSNVCTFTWMGTRLGKSV